MTGQGDYCTSACLLDYNYFKKYYRIIAIDLSKQQAFDVDPKAINFTGNLARVGGTNTKTLFIIEEVKETILGFSNGTVKLFYNYFCFNIK